MALGMDRFRIVGYPMLRLERLFHVATMKKLTSWLKAKATCALSCYAKSELASSRSHLSPSSSAKLISADLAPINSTTWRARSRALLCPQILAGMTLTIINQWRREFLLGVQFSCSSCFKGRGGIQWLVWIQLHPNSPPLPLRGGGVVLTAVNVPVISADGGACILSDTFSTTSAPSISL